MTWTSHILANGAIALAFTGRPVVAAAAMLAATLPDEIEKMLPWARHRGGSHWLAVWLAVAVAGAFLPLGPLPAFFHRLLENNSLPALSRLIHWAQPEALARQFVLGLSVGPLLHCLLDGFSAGGVPVGPFCSWRLKLGLYRTRQSRFWSLDFSEAIFLVLLLALCALAWKTAWLR